MRATTVERSGSDFLTKVIDTESDVALIKELKTYPKEDIIHVLMQMLDIAKICPEFTWRQHHRHWAINNIFDAASERVLQVIASPAETLNLVCRAILDEQRYPPTYRFVFSLSTQFVSIKKRATT